MSFRIPSHRRKKRPPFDKLTIPGKPNWQIRKQSGHKTDVMLNRYIRDGRLFADHLGGGVVGLAIAGSVYYGFVPTKIREAT